MGAPQRAAGQMGPGRPRRSAAPQRPSRATPPRLGVALATLALLAATAPGSAAPPDSGVGAATARAEGPLDAFMRSLADSTDRYFGLTAAPLDTVGLDSTLAHYIDHPESMPRTRRERVVSAAPFYRFNRVDGNVWGARLGLGAPSSPLHLAGRLDYAAGPNQWLGGALLALRHPGAAGTWQLGVGWDRSTGGLDASYPPEGLYWVPALTMGIDRYFYLRREGAHVELRRETRRSRLLAAYRDQREGPLPVAALWDLIDRVPDASFNLPARAGRVRAFDYGAGAALGPWPLTAWLEHETSSRRLESDFEYRRWRGVLGAVIPVGSWAGLATQLDYGQVNGDRMPQASFFFGGDFSLRSVATNSLAGTRIAHARGELVLAPDLLVAARLPHPDFLNLQAAATAAVGSVWGRDPFDGADLGGDAWPGQAAWRSEVGLALLYRPGLPDPFRYVRVDVTWPVGAHGGPGSLTASYTRLLNLLPAIGQ